MSPTPPRVRFTISLAKDVANRIDELVDGVKIRNRSHAIETLVVESLNMAHIHQAVIMAGGEHVTKRMPALREALKTLQTYGIFDVIMAVGYLGEQVRKEFGNGEQFGMRITYLHSELGTGGALLQIKHKLKQAFLVINIERPVSVNLKNLLKFHREHQPFATIATTSLRDLSGIYVFEPKVLNYIPEGFCMLEDTVFHELTKQGKLLPYPILTET